MRRLLCWAVLLPVAGCGSVVDIYERPGTWRPVGANDANLRAMIADPDDLVTGVADRQAGRPGGRRGGRTLPHRDGQGPAGHRHLQGRADRQRSERRFLRIDEYAVMDGGTNLAPAGPETATRSDRMPFLAFIADGDSETVLREGLAQALPSGFEIRRGNVRTALTALAQMSTPRALVIDITGESQPLGLLADLSHVLEPDVQVMIVGERQDVAFYRQVTRTLGATEYLYKPLVSEMVARHFGAQITHQAPSSAALGGRMVTVTGTRGGVGATTIAANLAWHLADIGRRHTALLDADLQTGTAAMLLGAQAGPGLRSALEQPSRVDELFIERAAVPLGDRLHIMASEEALSEQPGCAPGAAERLAALMRRRFNFVVADVPFGTSLAVPRPAGPDAAAGPGDGPDPAQHPRGAAHARPAVGHGAGPAGRAGAEPGRHARRADQTPGRGRIAHGRRRDHPGPAAGAGRRRKPGRAGGQATRGLPHRHLRPGKGGRLRRIRDAGPDAAPAVVAAVSAFGRRAPVEPAPVPVSVPAAVEPQPGATRATAPLAELRQLCLTRLDPVSIAGMAPDRLAIEVERLLADIATDKRIQLNGREQRQLAGELVNDMLGLGPLEPLLEDETVADIMVNGPTRCSSNGRAASTCPT